MTAPEPNRRRAPRVRVANLVGYSDKRSDWLYNLLGSAVTVDISESGVRVRVHEALPIGAVLQLELKLAGELHPIEGRVVWGEELDPDRAYEFGVRFVGLDPKLQDALRVYLSVQSAKDGAEVDS